MSAGRTFQAARAVTDGELYRMAYSVTERMRNFKQGFNFTLHVMLI